MCLSLAAGCAPPARSSIGSSARRPLPAPDVALLADRALAIGPGPHRWPREVWGLRLLTDAPRPMPPSVAAVRAIVRANHRLGAFDALEMATVAAADARTAEISPGFFVATILQESGFAPDAMSAAGAVGIGQFTLDTAAAEGVDPFAWRSALAGSARLLARYVAAYRPSYGDPYAVALAAYNAGPGAVAAYHGIPPYAETRDYVVDIDDRWGRLALDAEAPRVRR